MQVSKERSDVCLFPFFSQLGNPAFEVFNELPDGLHQAVGSLDFPVQIADIRLDTTLFHLPDMSPGMGWQQSAII